MIYKLELEINVKFNVLSRSGSLTGRVFSFFIFSVLKIGCIEYKKWI